MPNSTMVNIVFDWLSTNLPLDGSVKIEDMSQETSIIALQGPKSGAVLEDVLEVELVVRDSDAKR